MATRKASDSNLTGKKYNDASANATKIADVPDAPSTPTITPGTTVSPEVNFTAANTGGSPTTYTVAANPGNATWSGNTSPISATGLTAGTAYTFRVRGNNTTASGPYSPSSASVTVTSPQWGLLATYNSSTSYTVPSGITKLGVVVISGGNSGSGGCCGNPGAPGGSSGSAVGFWDYPVNSGTNYNVTVGGAGGTSNFGGIAQAAGTATTNFNTNAVIANSAGGGNNGAPYYLGPGAAGGSSSPANITLNITGNGPYNHPHGGGGGGGAFSGSGGPGGASYGGQGANGPGGSGAPGNGPGGGGGGASNSGNGGSGQAGRIYLYGFGNI